MRKTKLKILPDMQNKCIVALMLLVFTTRRMVRSDHLTLSLTRFTAQFDFAVQDRYLYEKTHTGAERAN